MITLGHFLLLGSLVCLGLAVAAAAACGRSPRPAWREVAVRSLHVATAFVCLASLLLWAALWARDYRLDYVIRHVSNTLPDAYRLAAFWAGQAGSLLFWLLLLTVFLATAATTYHRRYPNLVPAFLVFGCGTAFFFNLLLLAFTNPFAPAEFAATDGHGLNPLLQNVMMVFHPPLLFVGYVGFTIPWAFALAALVTGGPTREWTRICRPWTLTSWLFLTAGILLGAQWAYVELGWGGYWAWDPVENASLIPWLAGTALLHTSVLQERRGLMPRWNILLVSMTFLLCVFGTFITRSGFIESVHAFARSNIGYYFLAFIGVGAAVSLAILARRGRALGPAPAAGLGICRENTFLLTNWALMALLVLVLVGTLAPNLAELVTGEKLAVTESFFNRAVVPFAVIILTMLGLCGSISWAPAAGPAVWRSAAGFAALAAGLAALAVALGARTPGAAVLFGLGLAALLRLFVESYHQTRDGLAPTSWALYLRRLWTRRRPHGAWIAHAGLILMTLGMVGSSYFARTYEATVRPGETFTAGEWTLHFHDVHLRQDPEKEILRAELGLSKNGGDFGRLHPEKHLHRTHEQPMTEVAIHFDLFRDVYVIFSPLDATGRSHFKVKINPLVVWIWVGGALLCLGPICGLWPSFRRRTAPPREDTP